MVNPSQIFLAVVVGLALIKFVHTMNNSSLESFSAITQDLSSYQERAVPVGKTSVATLTSPGSGVSGHSLLSVGHASRSIGPNHFGFSIKAGLPLAEGGPVRFVYTEPSRFLKGNYLVYLENSSGNQMQIPGQVERLLDGSSRLYYFNKAAPDRYIGYDKVVVKYIREDGKESVVLSGVFN